MPGCRQRIPQYREYDDQSDAQPIMRHAEAEYRNHREDLIERPAVIESGNRAESRSEGETEQRRRHSQHEGIAQRAQQLVRDLQPGKNRGAQIACQHAAHPGEVLYVKRLVEPELGAELIDHRLRRLGRQ
jgi:hypothetical protein